jgi:hypothetical protein
MPPRSKKLSRFDLIPPGASFEDDVQLDELRQSWSLTFGEFLRLARERYGVTEHRDRALRPYLRSPAGLESLAPGLSVHDQLDPIETAMLCSALGLPAVDFGLPDDDGD